MILKKKIIFGTTGFLVASGVTALIVILATRDDESPSKAKVKIKLDVSKLSSDSFKASGTQTLGVVNLKSGATLPKQIELKYFVGTNTPASDKAFIANKPSNLKNGDIVYIKFFIKKASIANYEFKNKTSNPIKFVVSGLPLTTISHSLLTKESFVISGAQTQGKVSKKPTITLPKQVQIKYFRGAQAPNQDESYKLNMPTNLSKGDKVHIKFFIKDKFKDTHKFPDGFDNHLQLVVKDLDKNEVEIINLVASSFEVTGIQGTGQIALKSEIVLPEQVKVKYYKSISPPLSDSNYLVTLHSDLSNCDKVHIKFFIKNNYLTSHKFPDGFDNPIIYTIKNLKTLIDSSKLTSSAFVITTAGNLKTINKNGDVLLPQQVEARYYKSTSNLAKNKKYSTTWPISFGDGEIVFIRFFIKEKYLATHQFPTHLNNDITIAFNDVTLKTIINDAKLVKSSFQVRGSENIGILEFKDPASLPNVVEIRYLKQNDASNNDDDYLGAPQTALKNGDIVWIKFFIKDDFKTNHQFRAAFNQLIRYEVQDLKNLINDSVLVKESFVITGEQTTGTINWRTGQNAPVLQEALEVRYFKGTAIPNGDDAYTTSPPINLSNGDIIHIKFFIKTSHALTHKFRDGFANALQIVIRNLPKLEVASTHLNLSAFTIVEIAGNKKLKLKEQNGKSLLPIVIEAKYHRGNVMPSSDNDYSKTPLIFLGGVRTAYIKFFIKSAFIQTHKLANDLANPLCLWVTPSDEIVRLTRDLQKESFIVVPSNSDQQIAKAKLKDDITLPSFIHPLYAIKRSGDEAIPISYSKTAPDDLKNGDQVYVKFGYDENLFGGFLPNFLNEPFALDVVAGLEKFTIKSISLPAIQSSWFTFSDRTVVPNISGVNLPAEVQFLYAVQREGNANIPQSKAYKLSAPTMLRNGDKVYVKYGIQNNFKASHRFDLNHLNTPKVITVSGIKLNVIDVADLNKNAFEATWGGNPTYVRSSYGIRLKANLPLQVVIESRVDGDNRWYKLNRGNYIDYPLESINKVFWIRFAIKPAYLTTHIFPENFTNIIKVSIDALKKIVTTTHLEKESFEIVATNARRTLARIQLREGIVLSKLVYPLYAVQRNGDANVPKTFSKLAPSDLKNGDQVYVKFGIKRNIYAIFPPDFVNTPIVFDSINSLNEIIIKSSTLPAIDSSWFTFANRTVVPNTGEVSLPKGAQFIYAVQRKGNANIPQNNAYSPSPPTMLRNGDKVYVKYGIQNNFKASHRFDLNHLNTPKVITVSGIKLNVIDVADLNKNAFEATWGGNPTYVRSSYGIRLKANLPLQVVIESRVDGDNRWYKLNRGNYIDYPLESINKIFWIRFAIKPAYLTTHIFPENFTNIIKVSIDALKKIVTTTHLEKESFEIVAINARRTLARIQLREGIVLSKLVYPLYAVQRNGDANVPKTFSKLAPSDLKNGDKVYVKFGIKRNIYAIFPPDFVNTPIVFDSINSLNEIIIKSSTLPAIDSSWFTFANRTVVPNTGEVSLPKGAQFIYAVQRKGNANIPQDSAYSPSPPTMLRNGDKIYIKYRARNDLEVGYKIDTSYSNTPIVIIVSGIVLTKIDVTKLNLNAINISWRYGKKTFWISKNINWKIPEKVKIECSNNDRDYYDLPKYYAKGNMAKQHYIRFVIKSTHLSYIFPENFNNVISFIPSSRKTIIDTNLQDESFKIVPNADRTIASIELQDGVTLPFRIYVLYGVKRKDDLAIPTSYSKTAPNDLKNGDRVYLKYEIDQYAYASFKSGFTNEPFALTPISGLIDI